MNWRSKSTWIVGILILLGGVIAGTIINRRREAGPLFQGQPAHYWLRRLNSQNPPIRMQAFAAFNRTDSDSVPFLIAAISARETIYDDLVRFASAKLRPRMPARLANQLPLPNFEHANGRIFAMMSLRQVGSKAVEAVPALIKALNDPNPGVRRAAVSALSEIGPAARDANPALLRALNDKEPSVRTAALAPLQILGPSDPTVVPVLERTVGHLPPDVRLGAADLLWRLSHKSDVALPILIEALKEPEPNRFWVAAGHLKEMLPDAQAATPALVQALTRTNADNRVRGKAAITLGEMGPLAHAAVPALTKATNDVYSNVREAAVEASQRITLEQAPTRRE